LLAGETDFSILRGKLAQGVDPQEMTAQETGVAPPPRTPWLVREQARSGAFPCGPRFAKLSPVRHSKGDPMGAGDDVGLDGLTLGVQVRELERQVRRLRRALVGLVVGAVAVVTMGQAGGKAPESLAARAFNLVDADGRTLARLAPLGADGAFLAFVDGKGEQRLTLVASSRDSSIALVSADRATRLQLGASSPAPTVILSGRSGAEVAMTAGTDAGGSVLRLLDTAKGEVNVGTVAGSGASVNLSTPDGQEAQLVAGPDIAGVHASDRARRADATLSVIPKQGTILALKDQGTLGAGIEVGKERLLVVYDTAGKKVWSVPQ
jgi:hypothetical protein